MGQSKKLVVFMLTSTNQGPLLLPQTSMLSTFVEVEA